jgi:uncharacterized protein (TIGR03790 family)
VISRRLPLFAFLCLLLLGINSAYAQLSANDLVLVVNKRQPVGMALAKQYAQLRGVPDGRVIEIDVPDTIQIDYQTMQLGIAKTIRDQIAARNLQESTRCIVLFYGVPLRMADPLPGDQRGSESATIKKQLDDASRELASVVADMEMLAAEVSPGFTPQGDGSIPSLIQRVTQAEQVVRQNVLKVTSATSRQTIGQRYREIQLRMLPAADQLTTAPATTVPATTQSTRPSRPQKPPQADIQQLVNSQDRPQSRSTLRNIMLTFGTLGERVSLLQQQERWMGNDDMAASVDSELSMIFNPQFQRLGFIRNPLHYRFPPSQLNFRPMMVARIDAPTPEVAQRIMTDSIAAENAGLQGSVVVDARGNTSGDGYGQYDQTLRNFAQLVKTKTSLILVFDNQEPVLVPRLEQPDALPKDVMLYVGWYSLQSYQNFGTMVPGCVGYHIASFELIDLREPSGRWVHQLLNRGIAATIGPVAEPYTVVFPTPDEFFPLLLADRMTLAEAYWRTTLTTSWRGVLIGDPLYRPFRKNPPLKVEDMPPDLRVVRPVVEQK